MPLRGSSVCILASAYKNFCVSIIIICVIIVLTACKANHSDTVIDIIGSGIDIAVRTCRLFRDGISKCICRIFQSVKT